MSTIMKIIVWGSIGIAVLLVITLAGMIIMSGDASFLYNWRS